MTFKLTKAEEAKLRQEIADEYGDPDTYYDHIMLYNGHFDLVSNCLDAKRWVVWDKAGSPLPMQLFKQIEQSMFGGTVEEYEAAQQSFAEWLLYKNEKAN